MTRASSQYRALAFAAVVVIALSACGKQVSGIVEAVSANDRAYVKQWLQTGGNPNTLSSSNESLLHIATGPKGGNEVLGLLLQACANPNLGAYGDTPLMNAASWVNLPAVELLLQFGADPQQRNEDGKTAIDVVGLAGGREKAVIARLNEALQQAPSPSIKHTCQR
jgi:ankyrin repeat protein